MTPSAGALFEAPLDHEAELGVRGEAVAVAQRTPGGGPEAEVEADLAVPIARELAEVLARTVTGLVPGAGRRAAPMVRSAPEVEAELEAWEDRSSLAPGTTAVRLMTAAESLAREAASAGSEAEAAALMAATVPLTIRVARANSLARPCETALVQALHRLVRVLWRDRRSRGLLAVLPRVLLLAVRLLVRESRGGRPVDTRSALTAVSVATRREFRNPRLVRRTLLRSAVRARRGAPGYGARPAQRYGRGGQRLRSSVPRSPVGSY
jgi:hypothetical protein